MTRVRVHAPQDLVGGMSLVAVALFALWAAGPLATGRLGSPGPGLVPRVLAVLLALSGVWMILLWLFRSLLHLPIPILVVPGWFVL